MIACLDVDDRENLAVAACVLFEQWASEEPTAEITVPVLAVADYEPGYFYRRELPCLKAVLARVDRSLDCIVVDGYVWLDDEDHPGLGAHLYASLDERVPVVGVAKTQYAKATAQVPILKGQSATPLFITSAGVSVKSAAHDIRSMHGGYRIPTLLKRVDSLCRTTSVDRSDS